MAWIVGLCPGSRTITGCVDDDPVERDVDGVWVGVRVADGEVDRGCDRLGLVVRRDGVGDRVRLTAFVALVVALVVDGVIAEEVELVDVEGAALVGLELFRGREVPHAPTAKTVTSAIATPTRQRRRGVEGERDARVTWPR